MLISPQKLVSEFYGKISGRIGMVKSILGNPFLEILLTENMPY